MNRFRQYIDNTSKVQVRRWLEIHQRGGRKDEESLAFRLCLLDFRP